MVKFRFREGVKKWLKRKEKTNKQKHLGIWDRVYWSKRRKPSG